MTSDEFALLYCASFFILSFARCSPATSFPIFFSCQPKKKFCYVLKKASHLVEMLI